MTTIRRERLKQELRDEILSAARELFVREGYESASMRKIAEKVGVAPATLYLHFKDKDSILAAIVIETFSKLDAKMQAIADDRGDPLERLRRGGRLYTQFALDHPNHYLVTFGTTGAATYYDKYVSERGNQSFDCLRRNVKAAMDAGQLRFNDVEAVAQSLWAAMHGLVMLLLTKTGFPFVEQSRFIDTVLDITIEGIRAR